MNEDQLAEALADGQLGELAVPGASSLILDGKDIRYIGRELAMTLASTGQVAQAGSMEAALTDLWDNPYQETTGVLRDTAPDEGTFGKHSDGTPRSVRFCPVGGSDYWAVGFYYELPNPWRRPA